MIKNNIPFNKYYKFFNLLSSILVIISLCLLIFKGLNFGVDFKGGTLIELRANDKQITISSLRSAFSNMNLGDVAIKKFGKDSDYLIKFEKKDNTKTLIQDIKNNLTKILGSGYEFRRVENVGPKVSAELLKGGLIAIAAALGATPGAAAAPGPFAGTAASAASAAAFLSAGVCPENCLVGENSPSLWPTISSDIFIGINFLPLCIKKL